MGKEDKVLDFDKSEEDSPCESHLVLNNTKFLSSPFHDLQPPLPPLPCHENAKLAALCPFTPNPIPKNVDPTTSPLSLHLPHSPDLHLLIPSKPIHCILPSTLDDTPRTPRDGVFDPFAPGPDHLLLAPLSKKILTDSNKLVTRRLNFDDDDGDSDVPVPEARDDTKDVCTLSEKLFLDTIYGTLLEAIVKKQTEDFVAQNHPITSQEPHTPISPPRLTGIADTCLRAPVKAVSRKPRNVDPGLCRKLEF